MFKTSRNLVFLFILFILSGCGTVKQTKVRVYAVDKPRVDQQLDGNAGYLVGRPPLPEEQGEKDTRRIYVMEFSAPAPEVPEIKKTFEEEVVITPTVSGAPTVTRETAPAPAGRQQQPTIEVPTGTVERTKVTQPTEYIVEKDDTLQKISKKFYGSYSKWPKIYEENKDVIKNPDVLVPGTKIIIPTE